MNENECTLLKGVNWEEDSFPERRTRYMSFLYFDPATGDRCQLIADGSGQFGADHFVAHFWNPNEGGTIPTFWDVTAISELEKDLEASGFEYIGIEILDSEACFWHAYL